MFVHIGASNVYRKNASVMSLIFARFLLPSRVGLSIMTKASFGRGR
jgi:hypothetical protein